MLDEPLFQILSNIYNSQFQYISTFISSSGSVKSASHSKSIACSCKYFCKQFLNIFTEVEETTYSGQCSECQISIRKEIVQPKVKKDDLMPMVSMCVQSPPDVVSSHVLDCYAGPLTEGRARALLQSLVPPTDHSAPVLTKREFNTRCHTELLWKN